MQFVSSIQFPSNINNTASRAASASWFQRSLPSAALTYAKCRHTFQIHHRDPRIVPRLIMFWFYAFVIGSSVPCLAGNGENDPLHLLPEKGWQTQESHWGKASAWQLEDAGTLRNSDITALLYTTALKGKSGGHLWNPPHLILEPSLFSLGSLGRVWKLLVTRNRLEDIWGHIPCAWNGQGPRETLSWPCRRFIDPAPVAEGDLDRVDAKPCLVQGSVSSSFHDLHLSARRWCEHDNLFKIRRRTRHHMAVLSCNLRHCCGWLGCGWALEAFQMPSWCSENCRQSLPSSGCQSKKEPISTV